MDKNVGRFVKITPERQGTVRYSRNDGLTVTAEEAMLYVDIEWRREDHWFTEEDYSILALATKMNVDEVCKDIERYNSEFGEAPRLWSIPQGCINTKITGGVTIAHLPRLLRYLDEGIPLRDPVKPKEADLPGRFFFLEEAVNTLTQQVQALAQQVEALSKTSPPEA